MSDDVTITNREDGGVEFKERDWISPKVTAALREHFGLTKGADRG